MILNEYSFIIDEEFQFHWRLIIGVRTKDNDKYERILEAAVKVFAKQGFHQSTIAQIAREAGVADGTIYLYFKNKDDILVQFFDYKTRLIFTHFREDVEKTKNPVDKLQMLVRRHLTEFYNDKDMARAYQAVTHQKNPLVTEKIKEMTKMYLDIVAEIIEQGQMEGCFRKDLYISLVKRFILGAVETVIYTWLYSGAGYDPTTMAEPLVDLFIRGIGNPGDNEAR